ncbi:unnamed protein product, partial [Mesorhabditis belari]|uniref:HMG box domain-containing protein n=1 Tax=Mesorhabditis belari TaxID=2138241 RepID=A0AAF3F5Z1_9BILA
MAPARQKQTARMYAGTPIIKPTKKEEKAPKRALSAYMLWLAENRPRLTKPGMSVTAVAKAAGAEWKNVKDRSKWEKQASADKERYSKEMEVHKASK